MEKMKADFDVLILGGGPGGLSAALWCSDLGLSATLFEKEAELGGQLLITHNPIRNYLGVETNNGRELRDIFERQVRACKAEIRLNAEVVDLDPETITVTLADGSIFSGRAIIIATGVRRRKLNIPGETEFAGRGILGSGVASKDKVAGKHVVIIGGGDAALENAIILSKTADKVTVVHRREELSARSEFINASVKIPNIEFLKQSVVTSISGGNWVESVEINTSGMEAARSLKADNILIRVGVEPNTFIFPKGLEIDHLGYLVSDKFQSTGKPNVFAIGDVSQQVTPTVAGAAGQGASVAKIIRSNSRDN